MIPKVIHYCWFGKQQKSELIKSCIESWRRYCPEYKFMEWSEVNFDFNINNYVKDAYTLKKWAFVSDYVRLYALHNFGGIYLDTDVEILKSFDDLLELRAFTCFQKMSMTLSTSIIGSQKENSIIKEFLDYYENRSLYDTSGKVDLTPNPYPFTAICKKYGLQLKDKKQILNEITIFPHDYFCPYNPSNGQLEITNNTYAIHYFNATWMSDKQKRRRKKKQDVTKRFGKYAGLTMYALLLLKEEGIKELYKEFYHFCRKG